MVRIQNQHSSKVSCLLSLSVSSKLFFLGKHARAALDDEKNHGSNIKSNIKTPCNVYEVHCPLFNGKYKVSLLKKSVTMEARRFGDNFQMNKAWFAEYSQNS